MTGTLCASDNQVLELYYKAGDAATQNVFANSWTAPIDIASMGVGTFVNCEATVYLFNAGSKKQNIALGYGGDFASSAAEAGFVSPGQFISLPVGSAPWTNPAIRVIPSMQAFIVKATGASSTITLNYANMVYTPALESDWQVSTAATRAPQRRTINNADKPDVMRLHVAGRNGGCDLIIYLLVREDFTEGYDNGYDGRKMMGTAGIPQLYAVTESGKMSVNCVPDAEGTIVGFKPGEDTEYRFTFTYDGEKVLYLNDLQAHTSTLISNDNMYQFDATAADNYERFYISATPLAQITTDVLSGNNEPISARKVLINNNLYIIKGNKIYSATGEMVQ